MSETNSKVDVVFVFDTTGSMSGEISGMIDGANTFADTLDGSGVDYRIGCVTFGDASGGGDGDENFIDAIDYTRTDKKDNNPEGSFQDQADFSYRRGAKVVFVGITDVLYQTPNAPGNVSSYYDDGGSYNSSVYNTIEDEIELLQNDEIVMHVVSPAYYKDYYKNLAYETGGVWIDMDYTFDSVIKTVGSSISSNYIIRFTTADDTLDAFRHISFNLADNEVIIEYSVTSEGRSIPTVRSAPLSSN